MSNCYLFFIIDLIFIFKMLKWGANDCRELLRRLAWKKIKARFILLARVGSNSFVIHKKKIHIGNFKSFFGRQK